MRFPNRVSTAGGWGCCKCLIEPMVYASCRNQDKQYLDRAQTGFRVAFLTGREKHVCDHPETSRQTLHGSVRLIQ